MAYLYHLVGIDRMLQEDRYGVAGRVCRNNSQQPGVWWSSFASDGNSPVRGNVTSVPVFKSLPGCEQLLCTIWRENDAGLASTGVFLPTSLRILDTEHQPGGRHRPFIGQRSDHQRHLQRRHGQLSLTDGLSPQG